MRRLSSSNRSARDIPEAPVVELAEDGGPPGAPGGRRLSLLGLLGPPVPKPLGGLRGRALPSMIVYTKLVAATIKPHARTRAAIEAGPLSRPRQASANTPKLVAMK